MWFRVKPVSYLIFSRSLAMLLFACMAANIMVTQIFFDAVYKVSVGEDDFYFAVTSFLLFVFFRLLNDVLYAMNYYNGEAQIARVSGHINIEISKKSAEIDAAEYEDPKRLDDINKAAGGAGPAINFFMFTTGIVLRYATFFIFMGFYLTSLKPVLLLCLLFVFLPVMIAQVFRSSVFSKLEDRAAPIRREFDAYNEAACGKSFFKETRNLGAFKYLKNLINETLNNLNAAISGANKKSSLIDLFFNTLSLAGYGGVLFLLLKYLLEGEISVGAFAAVYYSIGMIFGIMEEVIRFRIGAIADGYGSIRNLIRFLEIPSDGGRGGTVNKKNGIIAGNAGFRYPNAESGALEDINLKIEPGETIAIVGENGAGKTTLVKLLTGLYKPTSGSVKIGGTDVDTASYRALFENVSGVFQKYQKYALTLGENVRISDFSGKNEVEKTLAENNIDITDRDIFPNGIGTMLSREFDGVDLSGGQWQRIAIARGFYRESDIIVLDEPTAAIDPIEESAIYKKFVEAAKDKTAIIVTHRMGSAKIAGRIIVMKDGRIAETGSHEELLESGGIYAGMYFAQAEWYK
jgi:ATP-binding cassette subfamily B protein